MELEVSGIRVGYLARSQHCYHSPWCDFIFRDVVGRVQITHFILANRYKIINVPFLAAINLDGGAGLAHVDNATNTISLLHDLERSVQVLEGLAEIGRAHV